MQRVLRTCGGQLATAYSERSRHSPCLAPEAAPVAARRTTCVSAQCMRRSLLRRCPTGLGRRRQPGRVAGEGRPQEEPEVRATSAWVQSPWSACSRCLQRSGGAQGPESHRAARVPLAQAAEGHFNSLSVSPVAQCACRSGTLRRRSSFSLARRMKLSRIFARSSKASTCPVMRAGCTYPLLRPHGGEPDAS
jgi:hypothetical protein